MRVLPSLVMIDLDHVPAVQMTGWHDRAMDTIERNVRIFQGHTIVQPSPTYEGFWARDTMIIALGLLDAGRPDLSGRLLGTWARFQIAADDDPDAYILLNKQRPNWRDVDIGRPDRGWLEENRGALPTSIYVGRSDYPDGTREIYSCHPDPDSTAWWLVACAAHVRSTGDQRFLTDLRPHLQHALDALHRRDGDGDNLIEQCANEDWADHMRRHGVVTYTQCVWYGAARAAVDLGLKAPAPGIVRQAIRRTLLTRRGVLDWRCQSTRSTRVTQDSALLVLFDILDRDEAEWLLRRLNRLESPHGHRVVTPAFRQSHMGPYRFKRGEYQNAGIWTWLTGWEAQARTLAGDVDGAIRLVDSCFCPGCNRIYEWVDPVRGFRYNPDFATGAGSILSAVSRLRDAVPA